MIAAGAIEDLVDQIAERFTPERVILFGSYAYGAPTEDSDVDLLIARRYRGDYVNAVCRIRDAVRVSFRFDLLIRTPADLRNRIRWGDVFILDVVENGIVLYDATNRRMGQQGRRRLRRRLHTPSLAKA